jgi:menaquinone-dependent protoporphyrinogen oxidase
MHVFEEGMMTRVLVAYASKYHATAEIAEEIGKALRQTPGLEVVVKDVSTVTSVDMYQAVILGSAVYIGQWQEAAAKFLKDHEPELAKVPVWLFSSGPTGDEDPRDTLKGWEFPEGLRPVAERIAPREIVLFHGKLDMKNLHFGERLIIKAMHPPIGDFRKWDDIRDWAYHIAETLKSPVLFP